LKVVFTDPSPSVGEVAGSLRIPVNQASQFLRALQARGLIRAQRHSRWVRYVPVPDPLVPEASLILKALRRALLDEKRAEADIRRTLTGFTHPRRLVILADLRRKRPVSIEDLAFSTQISLPALSRHLAKLEARALVRHDEQGWLLASPPNLLADTLVRLLRAQTSDRKSKVAGRPDKARGRVPTLHEVWKVTQA
jgi:predicted ArsR family transcriptional regulator